MRKRKRGPLALPDLKERAEHILSKRPRKHPSMPRSDLPTMVHELQVHQIELQMQNEELLRSQMELQAAGDRYEELYDFAPAGLLTLDRRGIIREANLKASLLLRISRRDLIGRPLMRYVVPSEQSNFVQHCNNVFRTGARQSCDFPFRSSGRRPPRIFHIESQTFPDGKETLDSCRVALFDITEQKQREAEHDRLTTSWRLLLDSTREGICGIDLDGRLTFINKTGAQIAGLRSEELLGKPMRELMPHLSGGTPFSSLDGLLCKASQPGQDLSVENQTFRRADGSAIPISYSASLLIERGAIIGVVIVFIDLSERKRQENELIKSKEQLQETLDRVRMLSQRLDNVQEEERTRIARELHDELGVRLTCLKMDLARLRTLLTSSLFPPVMRETRETMAEKITSMTGHVDETIVSIQRLVTELRPAVLSDLGLVAAIDWQCRNFEQRSGIRCACECAQDDITLDPSCATAAFRICQEALMNVVRHADATFVRVLLKQVNDGLMLEIQDDGQGIPPEKLTDAASFGLLGMRERASGLGGALEITGYPGKGTTVTLYVPSSASGDNQRVSPPAPSITSAEEQREEKRREDNCLMRADHSLRRRTISECCLSRGKACEYSSTAHGGRAAHPAVRSRVRGTCVSSHRGKPFLTSPRPCIWASPRSVPTAAACSKNFTSRATPN